MQAIINYNYYYYFILFIIIEDYNRWVDNA